MNHSDKYCLVRIVSRNYVKMIIYKMRVGLGEFIKSNQISNLIFGLFPISNPIQIWYLKFRTLIQALLWMSCNLNVFILKAFVSTWIGVALGPVLIRDVDSIDSISVLHPHVKSFCTFGLLLSIGHILAKRPVKLRLVSTQFYSIYQWLIDCT